MPELGTAVIVGVGVDLGASLYRRFEVVRHCWTVWQRC